MRFNTPRGALHVRAHAGAPPAPARRAYDVGVIGGNLLGLSAAQALAKRGRKVCCRGGAGDLGPAYPDSEELCSALTRGVLQVVLVDSFGLESEGLGREASSMALHLPQQSSAATR